MENYKITVLPSFDEGVKMEVGDHFRLEREPDNQYDPKAVAVYNDQKVIGHVAASKSTVVSDCHSAGDLFRRMGNKKLAEAWVILSEETQVPTSTGGKMRAFIGECTFIPVAEQDPATNTPIKIIVGGPVVTNPLRMVTLQEIKQRLDAKKMLPVYHIKKREGERGAEFVVVDKPTADPGNESMGIVLNPSDELRRIMGKNGSLSFRVSGLCEKDGTPSTAGELGKTLCFWGEFTPESEISNAMLKAMKDVTREGRDRYSSVEEKVKYMVSEGVPDEIIIATLKKIQHPDPEWACLVPHPKAVFRQSDGYGELSRCLAYRCSGLNLRLVGNKGSGKNTLAETIDWIFNQPQYRLEGNAEMDKVDLLGSPQLKDSSTTFELSGMIRCLMAGGDVVLDEGNTIRPEVAALLHSLTDESRQIQIPGYGLVQRHPESCVTLTMNEGYMGTTKMNEATVDRFCPIQMAQPASIESILAEAVPSAKKKDLQIADKIYFELKNKISGSNSQGGTLEPDCMTIRGFVDALRAAPLVGLKNALLDNVADKPQDEFSRTEIRELILARCK